MRSDHRAARGRKRRDARRWREEIDRLEALVEVPESDEIEAAKAVVADLVRQQMRDRQPVTFADGIKAWFEDGAYVIDNIGCGDVWLSDARLSLPRQYGLKVTVTGFVSASLTKPSERLALMGIGLGFVDAPRRKAKGAKVKR